jgi:hypothetical protein
MFPVLRPSGTKMMTSPENRAAHSMTGVRLLGALFLIGSAILLSSPARAECNYLDYKFYFGQESSTIMYADSGKPCAIGRNMGAYTLTVIDSVRVVTAPKNVRQSPTVTA